MKKYNILLLCLIACGPKTHITLQGYFFVGKSDEILAKAENAPVIATLDGVIHSIMEKDISKLLQFVHRKDGAIIDAKEMVSFERVETALQLQNSQLHRVLWNDDYWRKTAPTENIRSYQKTFLRAGEIRASIYYYSASECEVRIEFKNRPSMGIMGNPIFRKREGRWYLTNFF